MTEEITCPKCKRKYSNEQAQDLLVRLLDQCKTDVEFFKVLREFLDKNKRIRWQLK